MPKTPSKGPAKGSRRPPKKSGKAPAKRTTRSSRSKASSRPALGWRRWLFLELATWSAGLLGGLAIAATILWMRAERDVNAFLADPGRTTPGVVWSAPIAVTAGQAATVSDLVGDLLAGGYERVESLERPQQFRVDGGTLEVWTGAFNGPGFEVPEGHVRIEIANDRIAATEPAPGVLLRPTVLAVLGDLEASHSDVDLAQLSPWMEPAVLAIEDSRFREHHGVDPIGIGRALLRNLRGDGTVEGGSTLTQQLAKNLFLTPDRTMQRKVREAFFAAALESELDKDAILEMYLERVYLGHMGGVPLNGVEQAARAWFGVAAEHLTLPQAATLAGVIAAPNAYSPVRHPERAKDRRDVVLRRMVVIGAIEESQAQEAMATPVLLSGGVLPASVRRAPWAVDAAIDEAERALGEGTVALSGYQIHTTIQPLLQRAAEQALKEGMLEVDEQYPKAAGAEAALVAVRPEDGAVVAMVGGRDYVKSPFNRATNARRQAGSTVKPLAVLAAFDHDERLTPLSRVSDTPIVREVDGKPWTPRNYDGRFEGLVTLRRTLEASRNVPAVRIAEMVGYEPLQQHLRAVGLSSATHLPSSALGAFGATPWEMAGAYTVFPGGGTVHQPLLVTGIEDSEGKDLVTFDPKPTAIASARSAAMTTWVLRGVVSDGTGARAYRYGVQGAVGGKTGTTNDYRDAWFVGFSPQVVAAVWVGRDRGENLGLSGSRAALPAWARFMVYSGRMQGSFPEPDGVEYAEICVESARRSRDACERTYWEIFPKGQVISERCDLHGGPLVEAGRSFWRLFGGNREPELGEGDVPLTEEDLEQEEAGAEDGRERR